MTGAEFGGVDIDLLADYIGGALAGTPDEPVVAALVADDPAWRAAYASLGGGMELVGVALGRFGPEPMPADLAARLDAMFRTPADLAVADDTPSPAGRAAASADPAVADATPISAELAAPPTPRLAPVRAGREPSDLAGAAHKAADDAGAAREPADEVAGSRGPAGGRRDTRGPADGRPARSAARHGGRRMRWVTPIAVAAGLVAFVGFGLDYLAGRNADSAADTAASVPESNAGGAADDSAAAGAASAGAASTGDASSGVTSADEQILSTGTDYTLATLALEPPPRVFSGPEINASGDRKNGQQRASADREALGRLVGRTALDACLAAIEQANAGGPLAVSSVDYARFDGEPALVVRFSAANGRWAWASGPQCGAPGGGADTLGKVPVR